jgi:glycosyltransferase involved in cell wall biosynthesis
MASPAWVSRQEHRRNRCYFRTMSRAESWPPETGMNTAQLSVVVPFLDEEDVLPEFVETLRNALDQTGRTYEVIYVDEVTSDGVTAWNNQHLNRDWNQAQLVRLTRNFGHMQALTAGLDAASEWIASPDADLQHPPERATAHTGSRNRLPSRPCGSGLAPWRQSREATRCAELLRSRQTIRRRKDASQRRGLSSDASNRGGPTSSSSRTNPRVPTPAAVAGVQDRVFGVRGSATHKGHHQVLLTRMLRLGFSASQHSVLLLRVATAMGALLGIIDDS